MTNREFFQNVIAMVEGKTVATDEVKEKAEALIKALDDRNAKRAEQPSKKAIANKPIIEAIAKVLTDEPMLASVIAEKISTDETKYSVQKAGTLAKQVDGVKVVKVKVKGKGEQNGYFIPKAE